MSKTIIILIGFLALLGGGAGYWYYGERLSPAAGQRTVVRDHLSDPDSAKFRNDHASARDAKVWCGEVNARNRMGGMAGYARYIVYLPASPELAGITDEVFLERRDQDTASKDPTSDSAVFQSKWSVFCE